MTFCGEKEGYPIQHGSKGGTKTKNGTISHVGFLRIRGEGGPKRISFRPLAWGGGTSRQSTMIQKKRKNQGVSYLRVILKIKISGCRRTTPDYIKTGVGQHIRGK